MKWKLMKLFLPIAVIGFIMPMVIPGPDGKPIMRFADWLPDETSLEPVMSAVDKVTPGNGTGGIGIAPKATLYKWQDEKGQWHFSDSPAPNGKAADTKTVEQTAMPELVNTIAPPPDAKAKQDEVQQQKTETKGGFSFSPTTIPVQDIPKLIEDAKNLQKLADERNQALQDI